MVVRKNEARGDGVEDFEIVRDEQAASNMATISIALPASILSNAQSPELRMYLAGQVARAAAIYRIDEIIVFGERDERDTSNRQTGKRKHGKEDELDAVRFFQQVLEYLETPQYLRRHLFPVSGDLRYVGLLNPLALPSHVAKNDFCRFREGVAVGRVHHPRQQGRKGGQRGGAFDKAAPTKFVEIGQDRLVEIDSQVGVGERVTVDMEPSGLDYGSCPGKYLFGRLTDWTEPKRQGMYWGYKARVAESLSDIFHGSSVAPKGYDVTVGTSERGTPIAANSNTDEFELPAYSHLLIVFGGVHGLERSVEGDEKLEALGITSTQHRNHEEDGPDEHKHGVSELFDFYVNTCPNQGSRTIRTEEAILISLAALQPHLKPTT